MRRWRGKTKIITLKMVNNPIRRQDKKLSLKPSAEIIRLCIKKGSVRSFLSGNYRCITIPTAPVRNPLRTAGDWLDRQDQDCSMVHATAHWRRHHTYPSPTSPTGHLARDAHSYLSTLLYGVSAPLPGTALRGLMYYFIVSHNNPVQQTVSIPVRRSSTSHSHTLD